MSTLDELIRIASARIPYDPADTIFEEAVTELAQLRAALLSARKVIKCLEYVSSDDMDEIDYRYPYCPYCGYRKADGHWKDCCIGNWLEEFKETP